MLCKNLKFGMYTKKHISRSEKNMKWEKNSWKSSNWQLKLQNNQIWPKNGARDIWRLIMVWMDQWHHRHKMDQKLISVENVWKVELRNFCLTQRIYTLIWWRVRTVSEFFCIMISGSTSPLATFKVRLRGKIVLLDDLFWNEVWLLALERKMDLHIIKSCCC